MERCQTTFDVIVRFDEARRIASELSAEVKRYAGFCQPPAKASDVNVLRVLLERVEHALEKALAEAVDHPAAFVKTACRAPGATDGPGSEV